MLKDKILELLLNNQEKAVSGEKIAETFGVSRAAVCKNINLIKKLGAEISAKKNSGYILLSPPSYPDAVTIKHYIKNDFFTNINVFPSLPSTLSSIKRDEANLPEGSVYIADGQTGGYGRFNRAFYSPKGCGLYMSFLLRPSIELSKIYYLTLISAIAAVRAIYSLTKTRPGIKWVNDIIFKNKKLCGILCESNIEAESSTLKFAAIGIGINCFSDNNADENLKNIITDIESISKIKINRNMLAADFLNNFYLIYTKFLSDGDTKSIIQEYRENLCILNQNVTVYSGNKTFNAVVHDLNEYGQLIVQDELGALKTLNSGEISIKLKDGDEK